MQKYHLIGLFIFATLLAGRCGGGSKSGESASGGSTGGGTTTATDSTAPVVGSALSFSGISDTGVTVSWGAASDSVTSAANLQYRLVRAATSTAIDTIAKVDAAAGGVTVVDDYTTNLLTRNVTGLTATTAYFFAVVVRDAAGNKTIYTPATVTTAAAGTTASPVFNPAPGMFGTDQNLTMTSATSSALICYTSNGATPACNATPVCTTGLEYSIAVIVSSTATYKAIACKSGYTNSAETSGSYTIDKLAPTVASTTPANNATGVATGTAIAVTFSEAMTPSTIKAVTGGTSCLTSSPTVQVSSDNFTSCIPMTSATPTTSDNITFTMTPSSALSTATTYKIRVTTGVQDAVGNAIAAQYESATGFTTALAGALTINTFTPASGTYNTAQAAAATTVETGASICYTTTGVDPTAATPGTCDTSFVNEGQTIPIGTSVTLKILATKAGHANSAVATRTYSIVPIVTGTTPADAATGFDPFAGKITITFSKAMKRSSATFNASAGACTGNIQVSADNFTNCIGISIPAGDSSSFELTPSATLASATIYKVKVTNTLTDTSSNAVSAFTQTTGIKTRYYRTETIDGTNNFVAGETFATSSGSYSAYVTWDNTYVYVGYSGADVSSGTATKWVLLYLGDSTGSTTGVTYNTQTPTFPTGFNAKYHLRWKADNTYTNAQTYTAAWADAAWDFTGDVFRTGSFVEFRIPRADIGSPTTLKFMVNMVNEQGGGEWTYGLAPATSFTDGYAANPVKYLSCNLNSSDAPTTSCSVLP